MLFCLLQVWFYAVMTVDGQNCCFPLVCLVNHALNIFVYYFIKCRLLAIILKEFLFFCTRTITVLFFVYLNKQYFCILRFVYFLFCACLEFFFFFGNEGVVLSF